MFRLGRIIRGVVSISIRVLFGTLKQSDNRQGIVRPQHTWDGQRWNGITACSAQKCEEQIIQLPMSRSAGWGHDRYSQSRNLIFAFSEGHSCRDLGTGMEG